MIKVDENFITIVIPTYNAESYILKTINSVLNQTYSNYEIIVIDDCSKDSTIEIIEKIIKNNPEKNISLIKQQKNQGVAVARNLGIEVAKGRFLSFLDSDDIWLPNKLEKQLKFMLDNNYYFTFTAIEMIDEDDRITKKKRKIKNKVTYSVLLKNTVIATSTVMLDMKMIGNFKMPLIRSGQDYASWLLLLRDHNAYGINEALVRYRRSSNSLSSNKFKSIKQVYGIQRNQEGISVFYASFNTLCFILHAFMKHFF